MDYVKEEQIGQQTLKDNPGVDYWKPKEGRYKAKILSDPVFKTKEANPPTWPKPREVAIYQIEVEGKQYLWERNKKYGKKSVYGMLVTLGAFMQKDNKNLLGSTITIMVKGTGKDTSYDISELYDYIEKKKLDEAKPATKPGTEAFI